MWKPRAPGWTPYWVLAAGRGQGLRRSAAGVPAAGGAPNADAVVAEGTGVGHGVNAHGGASSGSAVSATGGAPNGIGIVAQGQGSGYGGTFQGGSTAPQLALIPHGS